MNWETIYKNVNKYCFDNLKEGETLTTNFSGEDTTFIRLNKSRIRQITHVEQGLFSMEIQKGSKKSEISLSLSLDNDENISNVSMYLSQLQNEIEVLHDSPLITDIKNAGTSRVVNQGSLPSESEFIDLLGSHLANIDLAGYLTTGLVLRGNANSLGQNHWFESSTFNFDYSLYTEKEKAVKGSYSGNHFDRREFEEKINESVQALKLLEKENKVVSPGKYNVYLAPSAVNEILGTMSWGALSGSSYKTGNCPLAKLYEGKETFSPKFSLKEDFSLGLCPKFNDNGEVSEEVLPLITNGKMDSLLVSAETEKEFGLSSNKASSSESPRSPFISEGNLKRDDILKSIGTGLYISDLHYLNWSDRQNGRITGMTRFGCLWVENGEIVGPIKDLRFDETLYHIFGDGLQEVTNFSDTHMSNDTYDIRHIGGSKVPGMLVKDFTFTL